MIFHKQNLVLEQHTSRKSIFHCSRLLTLLVVFVLMISTLSACKKQVAEDTQTQDKLAKSTFLLNTIVTITLYDNLDETVLDGALQLCADYEKVFSRTAEDSELYQLNHRLLPQSTNGGYEVSSELARLIKEGLYFSELSCGNFDVTIAPLSDLWNFSSTNPKVPDTSLIEQALQSVDYTNVVVKDNEIFFSDDSTMLDLGAIAKGFIADRIKDYLIQNGVNSAMINLGGNVLCVGGKPDGSFFNVGIQKPFADRNETIAIMELKDYSVVSSGIYERFFEEDGLFYHHILDPHSGYPYSSDLVSVTIICKESVDGDGLSTTTFALGLDKGLELVNGLKDTYAIFITDDYQIHYSDGFEDAIKITETNQ